MFEEVFHHSAFTGRSGTFFAYEGLGSIYWHMVGKLLLAARKFTPQPRQRMPLRRSFTIWRRRTTTFGWGWASTRRRRSTGPFPRIPVRIPAGQGAKQPGMTGAVKEEMLARMAELGVVVGDGVLGFVPRLLRAAELMREPTAFDYIDVNGQRQRRSCPATHWPSRSAKCPWSTSPVIRRRSRSRTAMAARRPCPGPCLMHH